ncbi:MAG: hypothetical protein QOF89_3574 [Acidobacteriota bacterium]|jgi:prophage DNA circulation protein|nr:hypothetical protein [Acidobacteriota bacterium]
MATINSYADIVLDWENILAACRDNAELLTAAEALRAVLEKLLSTARELNNRREATIGAKQQLTQELLAVLTEGKEMARRLRGAAKAQLGTKNERLVQFKSRPIRDRKGRKKTKKSTKAPASQPPATSPTAADKPAETADPKA